MSDNFWQSQVNLLADNMVQKIKTMKRQGTVSITRTNFKQIVPTKGIRVPVSAFDRLFDEAILSCPYIVNFVKG